ncbi:MAG: hypothetical protein EOO02_12625 [Chitinophagaceae bacterium]|nr:MAG: hypothetical protein EOO02_12625 [Chitinophagaceae bacterium]
MKLSEISTDKNYGYESVSKYSIKVGKIENQVPYLMSLRGPNGEAIQHRRLGSCCSFKTKTASFGTGFLDKYELIYPGLSESIIIYLNGYEFETPKAPVGLTFISADKIEKPYKFPADSIVRVKFCNETRLYSANESLLKSDIGDLHIPDTEATFEGGEEELKRYFLDHPLTDERLSDIVFKVSISYAIDCNGRAGNFTIVSKARGKLETYANQILQIVNTMPQKWKPATKSGEKVDSYQQITFIVVRGELTQFSYR